MPKSMNKQQKDRAKKILASRDGWVCHYCGQRLIPDGEWDKYTTKSICGSETFMTPMPGWEFPTIDHIRPLSKGGTNDLPNLVLCCGHCNCVKNDRWKNG